MENKLEKKLNALNDALHNFESSLSLLSLPLDANVLDAIESGQIQKFEFTVESLWKTMKIFLWEKDRVELTTPGAVMRAFCSAQYGAMDNYELLMQMLKDRNITSHVYRESDMKKVHEQLPVYATLMHRIFDIMKQHSSR